MSYSEIRRKLLSLGITNNTISPILEIFRELDLNNEKKDTQLKVAIEALRLIGSNWSPNYREIAYEALNKVVRATEEMGDGIYLCSQSCYKIAKEAIEQIKQVGK